jgi:tetratricopeptide (TPR) repeat protein/predicted Ser/Thr protein kinase
MSRDRWERLNDIFHAATSLDPAQRNAYLDEACRGDVDLRGQAERLITAHERAGQFIETPAISTSSLWPDRAAEVIEAGRRFGPYRVLRDIARGGMGAVYLAERADGQYERRVALKVIKRGLDIEPMLRRFRAERQILASLEHPNIARLLDGGTSDDGQPFFAMEFIDGEPIDQYARSRSLSITERLRLFLPVCDAVAYAHRLSIIHRDIKPANILVTADRVPKLLDFGIAKALTPDAPGATTSVTGFRLLTPEYASPEQVEGQTATIASDIYSLGVVLYELLTGGSPYQPRSRDPLDVADAVRTTIPERPSATTPPVIRRQLRGDLDTIVLAALRKEPGRRYPSVEQLAADIRRHLDGLPINARRDSVYYRAGKFLRRNRAAVIAAGAAVLATSLIGAAVVVLRAADAEPSLLQSGVLATRDRIVVSRFTDQTGDTLLAAAITEAFRTDLTQSPHLRVLTPAQVSSALERMQHQGGYIPNDSVARDLAVREGAKAFVSGALARVGGAYAITVQLIGAESGEALTAVRETAADSTELIAAVGRASRTMRQRLGETLRDLRDMPALEKATTASLPALRKYTEGYGSFLVGDRPRAIRLYEEAVALDTAFATAYSAMAGAYGAMDEPGRAHAAKLRALAHLDRLALPERGMMVASSAYGRNDYETAIREYSRLLERYPTDVPMLNNLALAHRNARQFAAAESLWHRAIAVDSTINVLYYGVHSSAIPQGKIKEGRRILDIVRRRFPDDRILLIVEVQQAAAEQAWDAAERLALVNLAQKQRDSLNVVDAYEQLAGIAMTQGRLREAGQRWHMQLSASTRSESYGRRLFGAQQLAYLELRYHNRSQRARAIVDSVLALLPLDRILPGDRPYEALARFYARAGDVARARTLLAAADGNNRSIDVQRPAENAWTRGVIALAERRVREAETALREAARRHDCPICVLPDLARAYDAAGKREQALATYEEYLTTPWLWRYETDAIELGRAMTRAGELHELRNEPAKAVAVYTKLLRLWEKADGEAARERDEVRRRISQLVKK